eukprot:scaffold40073_cov19-Tisochrysis_lutea.AAC.1
MPVPYAGDCPLTQYSAQNTKRTEAAAFREMLLAVLYRFVCLSGKLQAGIKSWLFPYSVVNIFFLRSDQVATADQLDTNRAAAPLLVKQPNFHLNLLLAEGGFK